MTLLTEIVAAHPLRKYLPYNAIKFVRVDGNGTPLYRVRKNKKELGAAEALRTAFEQLGGHCFHCKHWMPAQPLSQACTRDHLRPRSAGGCDYLHNLVLACGPCNRRKGGSDLITFSADVGAEYMKALDEHLVSCIKELDGK